MRLAAALARQAIPLGVAAAAFTVAVGLPSSDPDMWWHLATGRWVLDHRELLRIEIFSSTAAGRPEAIGEWLGQIVLALTHAGAGWTGLAVLRAAAIALAAFSLTRIALRAAGRGIDGAAGPRAGAAVAAVSIVAIALAVSKIAWTDRPQIFTLALFPVLLDLLFAARSGSTRALVAVPPLLFVWSDLHGAYALGVVVTALFAIDAAVSRRAAGPFALATLVSLAAVALNPGAIGVLPATTHVATAPRAIVEEAPPDVLTPAGFVFGGFVVATLAALLWRGGPLLAPLLLVPLLWLAFSAQRHMVFFIFAATPFLADALAYAWTTWRMRAAETSRSASSQSRAERLPLGYASEEEARRASASTTSRDGTSGIAWRRGGSARSTPLAPGIAAIMWIGALASIATAPTQPDESLYPKGALEALRSSSGVLVHEYDWGGYLIWSAPERPVFVDGRLLPYMPDIVDEHRRVIALRPGWRSILERYSVAQVLLAPTRPLAGALREDGWRVVFEDERSVLLERPK